MTSALKRGFGGGASALLLCLMALPGSADASPRHADRVVFHMQSSEITESSSLVVSTTHPHLVYTANDSGDSATVYVLDSRTGELVGRTDLLGVDAIDIEALAGGTDGSLVVADIGDNAEVRDHVTIYRIPQPAVGDHSVTPDAVSLTYNRGPRDAEGALYDAESGRVFIISKEYAAAHIYASPRHVFTRTAAVLRPVADAPGIATDATFLPGGDVAVIRTYLGVTYYEYPSWTELTSKALPLQQQGESVAAPEDGTVIWVGSEGDNSPVLAVPIPDLTPVTPPSSSAPPTTTDPDAVAENEHRDQLLGRTAVVIIVAVVLLAVVVGILLFRFIRHPRR
jgi:hypothetical protein